MDSPETPTRTSSISNRSSSVIDSIRGCTLAGVRIPREELKRKIMFPEYLRLAIVEAIRHKDVEAAAVVQLYEAAHAQGAEPAEPPEFPLVVFINSKSGGRQGPELKARLQSLISEEQVFDLSAVKPHEFVQYGLSCLEKFSKLGDNCAYEIREKLRIAVAGGDGTVGWVLGCLGELNKQGRLPIPPTGIIPLGTGNDLSRSFGWGGSFPFNWKSAVKRTLDKVISGPVACLDSWHLLISMPAGEDLDVPYSLKQTKETPLDPELEVEEEKPQKVSCYQGVFYNYFSIGMDAQVAYGFHHLRNEKPYLAQGPFANKIIYSGYSCKQGWFFTPCSSDPGLRSLKNILRIYAKKVNCFEWEQVPVPSSVRSIVALNLPSYGSGRNPWGNLKPDYLEKRGFVEANADDGLLEVFGFKQGWHASMFMVELISAKHITQASAIRFELRGGEWTEAYMQMDGEPWKQPMNKEFSTFLEIKRVPHQSVLVKEKYIALSQAETQACTQEDQTGAPSRQKTPTELMAKAVGGRNKKGRFYGMPQHTDAPTSFSVTGPSAAQGSGVMETKVDYLMNAVGSIQQTLDRLLQHQTSLQPHGSPPVQPSGSCIHHVPQFNSADSQDDDDEYEDYSQ